ncbi:MAG: hypothetical protein JW965_06870 [Bacteroidales bacterium]|nr:hypothetical protein [Bacteroidales bacterium]
MNTSECAHQWEMVNTQSGFIVTETCHKCNLVTTYFSREEHPPLEEYRDGEHFWNIMASSQSVSFDLRCKLCNTLVSFDELSSLMLCTGCDKDCKVFKLLKRDPGHSVWVYVAFGFKPYKDKQQLSKEKLKILEDYFNAKRRSTKSSIKIVSFEMIDDLDSCKGGFIMDEFLLSLAGPTTK